MQDLVKRLREPSSAASLAAIIQAVASAGAGMMPWTVAAPAILAGLLGIVLPERGPNA